MMLVPETDLQRPTREVGFPRIIRTLNWSRPKTHFAARGAPGNLGCLGLGKKVARPPLNICGLIDTGFARIGCS
jgi:hypothetical protein